MKDLDSLLGQGEPEKRNLVVNYGLDTIHLTDYAYEKAYTYARLAVKKARGTIECGGYLIAPREAVDRIATDAFLARNQDVSSGLFTIEAEEVIKAGREINEMGYRVLGWWHSHGNLQTFFSDTDNRGQRTVLNEIGSFNYVTYREEKDVGNLEVRVEDGKLVMFDKKNPGRKYEVEVDGDASKISIAKLKLQQEKRIGFAYGLVVNNKRIKKEPYAEIATRELCGFCRSSKDKSVPVNITLFDRGKFTIDEKALMDEIKERVRMRSRFFKLYKGRKYKGAGFLSPKQTFLEAEFGGSYLDRYSIHTAESGDFTSSYKIPIQPTQNNPQSNKVNPPADKKDGHKRIGPAQDNLDDLLYGEQGEGDKSLEEENGSK